MRQIGILGGTFNPIHFGHLILAQNALEEYHLDRIIFIPSGCSYMKEHVLDAKSRYEMTKLAVEENPSFEISDMEYKRTGNSYTCDTLNSLTKQNPDCRYEYIIGADTLMTMETWKSPEIIFESTGILCAVRSGTSMDVLIRKKDFLSKKYHAQIRFLQTGAFDISSSDIRKRIRQGQNVSYFVPKKVLDYITEHHLYEKDFV